MASNSVADFLRSQGARIAELWEAEVRLSLPEMRDFSRPALLDHVQEVLDGIAAYIDGDAEKAQRAFDALVHGHALQRLGYGVGLETLIREYSILRSVVLRELRALPTRDDVRAALEILHEAMDHAISRALERYAQRREEVRDRFIGILGHDLRDPLSTVTISTTILSRSPQLPEEHRIILARMQRATDRMQRMINEVLDFARGHLGGGIPANPTLNDMAKIVREAVDEISPTHPDRVIQVHTRGDLRGAFDHDRVRQAIGNLIRNGIQHGTGDVSVEAYEETDKRAIITSVTNRGQMIPPELLPRLFDPFTAGADPHAPRAGLGLGLYIVNQVALSHGATTEVESHDDVTKFTIRWPRSPGEERRKAAS